MRARIILQTKNTYGCLDPMAYLLVLTPGEELSRAVADELDVMTAEGQAAANLIYMDAAQLGPIRAAWTQREEWRSSSTSMGRAPPNWAA